MRWVIDGNNVMGALADGWWNDPPAAAARLAQRIARWCRTHEDPVTVVFDGAPNDAVSMAGGGNLTIDFATRLGRDAADDRIVDLVEDWFAAVTDAVPELTVVTSDRGLVARLPPGVVVLGGGRFAALAGLR